MNNIISATIQVLPIKRTADLYEIVDQAIEVIQKSGLKYKVTPFETVVEGFYDQVMQTFKEVQEICFEAGSESLLTLIKINSRKSSDVHFEDNLAKYPN